MTSVILINQHLAQPTLEKLPLAADGNKYRDPQPESRQRDFKTQGLKGVSPSNQSAWGSGNSAEEKAEGA